jgi:uncharacterized protein YkwD
MALVLAATVIVGAPPAPAAATTATPAQLGSLVISWMNRDRVARGLVPLRAWSALTSLATDRAKRMAATDTLSHDAAGGDVGDALSARSVPWFSYGEIIGTSTYPWGSRSAANLYSMWKASTPHRTIMFSGTYNYVGAGFARGSDGSTWASVVFTESKDHTRPIARNGSLSRSGTTIYFHWSGRDRRLQTHTAGLRSFDVQMRRDGGAWRTIRNDTTATRLTLRNRAHGHWYSFRVQSADRRGNLSKWTSTIRIWVP